MPHGAFHFMRGVARGSISNFCLHFLVLRAWQYPIYGQNELTRSEACLLQYLINIAYGLRQLLMTFFPVGYPLLMYSLKYSQWPWMKGRSSWNIRVHRCCEILLSEKSIGCCVWRPHRGVYNWVWTLTRVQHLILCSAQKRQQWLYTNLSRTAPYLHNFSFPFSC